ncbi:RsmE family RNA methyltransferase, partial [bacterium]|nr:RsmE family RNA methyltransferase [bacterium]
SAERSVVRLEGTKAAARTARWRRVAAEAAKQSQLADVPHVTDIVAFADLPAALADSLVLVCWEDSEAAPGIGEALRAAAPVAETDVAIVVGPEGGLTSAEVRVLQRAGASVCSLGSTILRTETAGVVAAALALYERGGLGGAHRG